MRTATLDKVQLHWREDGEPDGLPVVFANSLGTDLRIWDTVLLHLPKGLRLIRFDLRGHGLSSCPPPPYSMDDLIDDAEQFLDLLGVQACVFVGVSIGGMIAQGLGAKRADLVKALCLSNTAVRMGDEQLWHGRMATIEAGGMASIADTILQRWFGPTFGADPRAEIYRNMLMRTPRTGYIGCCHAIAASDLTAVAGALRQPTVVVAGDLDRASPPDLVEATANLIPGAEFHLLRNVGHLPCVEAPKAFGEILSAFLKEVAHV